MRVQPTTLCLRQINATTIGVPRPCRIERADSKQTSRS